MYSVENTRGMRDRSVRQRQQNDIFPILWLTILLAANSILLYGYKIFENPLIDYFTAWSVPKALSVTKAADIYTPEDQKVLGDVIRQLAESPLSSPHQVSATKTIMELYEGRIDATGTPFVYAVIGLFSTGDYAEDRRNYIVCCLICFILSLLILCRLLRFSFVSTSLIITFFVSAYSPVIADIKVGNVNQIQLLMLTLFIWLAAKSKHIPAAALLGIGAMFKPTTAAVCLLSLLSPMIRREYKILIRRIFGIGIGAMIAFLISIIWFSSIRVWLHFFQSLPKTLNFSYPLAHGNFSFTKLIFDAFGKNMSLFVSGILIAAFSYAIWKTKNGDTDRNLTEGFVIAGVGIAIPLLSAGLIWVHYYILLIPLLLFTMRPVSEHPRQMPVAKYAGISSFFSLLMLSRVCDFLNISLYIQSLMINLSTLMLTFFTLYELNNSKFKVRNRK